MKYKRPYWLFGWIFLSHYTARRQQIARVYFEQISNSRIQLLAKPVDDENHVYHLFVILCHERKRLAEHMLENNIEIFIHYPIPFHRQVPCSNMAIAPRGLTSAEKHAEFCLSIPCNPHLTASQLEQIIGALNAFAG